MNKKSKTSAADLWRRMYQREDFINYTTKGKGPSIGSYRTHVEFYFAASFHLRMR